MNQIEEVLSRPSYDSDEVPLWGMKQKRPEHCRIETDRECGCAFGQCERGLIF